MKAVLVILWGAGFCIAGAAILIAAREPTGLSPAVACVALAVICAHIACCVSLGDVTEQLGHLDQDFTRVSKNHADCINADRQRLTALSQRCGERANRIEARCGELERRASDLTSAIDALLVVSGAGPRGDGVRPTANGRRKLP